MSCSGIREALASCILKSDCVLRSDPPRTPQDCLKHHVDELPEECQLLRKSFFECKKGMVSSNSLAAPEIREGKKLKTFLSFVPIRSFSVASLVGYEVRLIPLSLYRRIL